MTRLFEWSTQWDGPDAFFDHYEELIPLVEPGYRHMSLDGAAEAFERLLANPIAQRLLRDKSFVPDQGQLRNLADLVESVGWHQDERLDFVVSHASSFAL